MSEKDKQNQPEPSIEQLHPNKKGREDCANCPTPARHCSECINRDKRPKSTRTEIGYWRNLAKYRQQLADEIEKLKAALKIDDEMFCNIRNEYPRTNDLIAKADWRDKKVKQALSEKPAEKP